MKNNMFAISTTPNLQMEDLHSFTTTGTKKLDTVRALLEYFFTTEQTLKEQNKFLVLFLQTYIQENDIEILTKFLSADALKDLHPSLLKSTLIMTEHFSEIAAVREKAVEIFNEKMQAY